MYTARPCNTQALNLEPLSPSNLRYPYAAKFYIASPRTRHKILKSYSEILKLARAAKIPNLRRA
ncbi:hypothetical protein [uncultured Campylobacter sp.]|uniref:hypothetical protein n=1 Tax=uncultured Campylobacter sp. TaxID=218934 RepID=UPI0026015C47|nr:hypothetical protein [uncultured Campylobacter sp.]